MITSADNPRVKLARSLQERRGRQQHGQCLAEGVRLIEDAMRAGMQPALVFFAGDGSLAPRAATLLDQLVAAGIPAVEVSPAIFATLSDTVTSQGLVAVLSIPELPAPARPALALVLDGVRDPGNLGTILRTADAAGADLVLLLRGCADAWSPKVLRAGMGAHFRLPLKGGLTWTEAAQHLAGCAAWLADVRGEYTYDSVDWTAPSALVVSGETTGVSDETLHAVRGRVAIPMPGAAESLNVAMAATVLLFEAVRQRRTAARLRT